MHDKAVSDALRRVRSERAPSTVRHTGWPDAAAALPGGWTSDAPKAEAALSPWADLDLDAALAVVSATGAGRVTLSPFLTSTAAIGGRGSLRGAFSGLPETELRRSTLARAAPVEVGRAEPAGGAFAYRFPSIVAGADLSREPRRAAGSLKQAIRARIAAAFDGPGEEVEPATLREDHLAEAISDVAARRAAFLARVTR